MSLKKLIVIVIALVVLGGVVGLYLYTKEVTNVGGQTAIYILTSASFLEEFTKNAEESQNKYNGKIISITGSVGSIEQANDGAKSIVMNVDDEKSIICQFRVDDKTSLDNLKEGTEVTIKGKYAGYDDLIGLTVSLKDCYLEDK